MLACQGSYRDNNTDVSTSTSARQTAALLRSVSLTGRSLFLSVCSLFQEYETVSADWLIYYVQAGLSVKVFASPILQFFCNLFVRQLSVFSPILQARANYMLWLISVKGLFETRLFLFRLKRFSFLPVFDSEAQLYAVGPKSQAQFVCFGTF